MASGTGARQVWLLFVAMTTSNLWAQEFTPARFGEYDMAVTDIMRVPIDRPPGGYNVSLTCQVIVETDGTTTNPHCLVDERYRTFQWEVVKAVTGTLMEPATVDGVPVRVLMNFMVGFQCVEACNILLISNHARHIDELGVGYSSPQPILEAGVWYQGYGEKLAWISSDRRAEEVGGIRFIVSTKIDRLGRSSRRRIEQESDGFWLAANRAARSLDDIPYIPAFQKGRPVEMTLYEYWLDPNGRPPEMISIPVRVYMLSSEFVDPLDSTSTDLEVAQFLDSVNSHWRPAGIQWTVESIVHVDAERQLRFRRVTGPDSEIETAELQQVFSTICPVDPKLEGVWNVCFVRQFPWVANYFGNGLIVLGELDPRGERVQPFALARELGESLGLRNTPTCTARFLGGVDGMEDTLEGTCVSTQLSVGQIRAARAQAERGRPFQPSGRGRRR